MLIWIGYFPIRNVITYPVRGFLSTLLLRSYATTRGPDDVHVGNAAHAQVMRFTCVSRG